MLPSLVQASRAKNTGRTTGPNTGPPAPPAAPSTGKPSGPEGLDARHLAPSDEELRLQYQKLRQAVTEEPDVPGHHLLLGDICLRLGRKEEAKAILAKAIERHPPSRPAVLDLLKGHLRESELAEIPVGLERRPFYQDAASILEFPLRGNGPVLLIGGGVVFTGLAILAHITFYYAWIPALIGLGYLASYMMSIIESSARGQRNPPDYPDFSSWGDSVLGPFWIFLSACAIPAALPVAWIATMGLGVGWVFFLLLGLLYWPMALVAGSMLQSAESPLNVPLVIRAIRASAREYFPAVLVIYGMGLVSFLVALLIAQILPYLFAEMIGETLFLYFLLIEMHILGRVYLNHSREIGWFQPKEAPAPLPVPAPGLPPVQRIEPPSAGNRPPPAPTLPSPPPVAGRQPPQPPAGH